MKEKFNLSRRNIKKTYKSLKMGGVFLLFIAMLVVNIESLYAQRATISINARNITLQNVFEKIEQMSDYVFLVSDEAVTNLNRTVEVNFENAGVEQVLVQVLHNTALSYLIVGRQISIYKAQADEVPPNTGIAQVQPVQQQPVQQQNNVTVTGSVVNEFGEPLTGATIQVRGTTLGTITDIDGRFTLLAPAGGTLLVSFIGYTTQAVAVSSIVGVILMPDTELLDEIVVTALGISRDRRTLGYAVQNMDGAHLQTVRGVDVATSLTGRISGMTVFNPTEFSAGPRVLLRGAEPLLVIDGVPFAHMTLREIAADDIESISVLKGAAASALYGARGQNGAIMVTTRRGAERTGTSISVNSGTMFTAGFLAIPEQQYTFGRRLIANPDGTFTHLRSMGNAWGPVLDGREVIQWCGLTQQMRPMPFIARGRDNFRNFLEQGHILNNNISIAQSGEFGNLRASATWVNHKGVYPNARINRFTYSLGGDIRLGNVTLSSALSYTKRQSPNLGFDGYTAYDPMYALLIWTAPDWDIRDFRNYWIIPNEVQNSSYTTLYNNPFFDRFHRTNAMNRDIFSGMFEIRYEPSRFWNTLVRIGYDTYSERRDVRVAKGSFQGAGRETVIPGGTQIWGQPLIGSYSVGISRGHGFNVDFITSGNYQFGDFAVDGFVGGSITYSQDEGLEAQTRGGLSMPAWFSLNASVNPVFTGSRISRSQTNSLYGRVGVSWRNLAFAEATLRNDWVSTLTASERSYLYPSVSGSFVVSELLPEISWLSLWQLRGSWVTSKRPAAVFAINNVYTTFPNTWGTMTGTRMPAAIRGADIFPESIENIEFGTGIHLLRNRLSVDVTYYTRRAFDFIRSTGISPASGHTSSMINIDEEITRRGVELTINATPVMNRDWRWNVAFNWSRFADFWTRLDEEHSLNRAWIAVGNRADVLLYRGHQRDPYGNLIHTRYGLPARVTWDQKKGYSNPDWIWGLSNNISYRNWQLAFSFDGRVGGLIPSITEIYMWRSGNHPRSVVPERFLDAANPGRGHFIGEGVRVLGDGVATFDVHGNILTDTRVLVPNDLPVTFESYVNALHHNLAWGGLPAAGDIFSGTFFKLREMSLTYTVPRTIASRLRAEQMSVSLIGQNLFLWAKEFEFSDPDGGVENLADPSLRMLGFNIRMSF